MRRPIEVVMDAGLGNEMFQYAIGRALSIRLNRPLVLDISLLFQSPGWGFDLPCFKLGKQRIRDLPYPLWWARTKMLQMLRSWTIETMRFVEEPSLQFWSEALQLRNPCILRGYWQSERYFESIAGQLRDEFTIIREQDARSAECQTRICRPGSIGLHVRRGDYLTAHGKEDFHGTCSKEYYDAALKLALARVGPNAELFVFSDDMEWSRQNIRYGLPTVYVDWNADRDYEDLRLMSQCHALIMANSTFSWWGGWLNSRPDKMVVAPRLWFRAPGAISDLPNSPWLIAI
ncbi:MAG: alpha-1,2-fucosyltransferase [Betaproteobacteria bacterium]|nr:alpha-1,2-fucosyltransferase [Betaproteobacteria bacterium]